MKWASFRVPKQSLVRGRIHALSRLVPPVCDDHPPRGYSMMLVLGLLALLAVAITGLIQVVVSSTQLTRTLVQERRAFFAVDDVCRIIAKVSQPYLANTVNPDVTGLKGFLESPAIGNGPGLPNLIPAGWTLDYEIEDLVGPYVAPVPNGPFEGMSASQSRIKMRATLNAISGGATSTCSQEVVLGSVSAFQFYIFGDVFLDWNPVPLMNAKGHAHSNYDFCIGGKDGSGNGLKIQKITSAGRILHATDPDCRYPYPATFTNTWISKKLDPNFGGSGDFAKLLESNDHNCGSLGNAVTDDCPGDKSWAAYAIHKWKGQVLDSAHGVSKLSLPVSGTAYVQDGRNVAIQETGIDASAYREENNGHSRFVVDPVWPNESDDVRAQKFAYKADVRIINGAWYLKDENDPDRWPGIPIWSDHPGSHSVFELEGIEGTDEVGQETLRGNLGWATTPKRFSYYGYDAGDQKMTWEPFHGPAVISYGAMGRVEHSASDVYWYPHHWTAPQLNLTGIPVFTVAPELDEPTLGSPTSPLPPPHPLCMSAAEVNDCTTGWCFYSVLSSWGGTQALCGADGELDARTALLNGTRSGFRYGYTEIKGPPLGVELGDVNGRKITQQEEGLARVLPVNFDMAAFQAALQDCSPGELGSYFPGTCSGFGREFNGIVYITSTWDGMMEGMGTTISDSDFASYPPKQGTDVLGAASFQPKSLKGSATMGADFAQNRELPYALCSDDLTGAKFESSAGKFTIPACSSYNYAVASPVVSARPNAIQIVNAKYINPKSDKSVAAGAVTLTADFLPKGLTVATNLPMYVVGDVNTETNPTELDATKPGYHFTPILFAADHITLHSSNYNDQLNGWEKMRFEETTARVAADTTYNCSLYVGWSPPSPSPPLPSDGIENVFRFHEDWLGKTLEFNGSQVVAFHSVYGFSGAGGVGSAAQIGRAPKRDFSYDKHLDALANQPPGAPLYEISGIYNWRAE